MRLIRGLAAVAICAGVGLGLAGPSQAQGDVKAPGTPEGVYTVNIDGQATTEWTIFPICVPTVGDLRDPLLLPVACRLKVMASRGGAEAVQNRGRWTFEFTEFSGGATVTCPDGSTASQREVYAFDGITLAGDLKVIRGAVCDQQPSMTNIPFTMAFKEPLPIPVTDYPLICEPGGLRRCF